MNPENKKRTEYSLHDTCSGSYHRVLRGKGRLQTVYICLRSGYIRKAHGVFHTVHQQIRRSNYDKRRYYQT